MCGTGSAKGVGFPDEGDPDYASKTQDGYERVGHKVALNGTIAKYVAVAIKEGNNETASKTGEALHGVVIGEVTVEGTEYTQYEEELKSICEENLFTKQDIKDAANAGLDLEGDEEDDNAGKTYDKYSVDPNSIVVVSYGDRAPNSNDKTVKKTFILNYNNYAVRVTYAETNITYTIPAGGYVMIG